MPDIDAVQLRILTHYAAGTELSSIAAILRIDFDEVVDVVSTIARFDRSRASKLICRQDRPRPTAPAPARFQRIEFTLPPLDEPEPSAGEIVQPEPSTQVTVPVEAGRDEPASIVESSSPRPVAAPERLGWWDSFMCLECHSRSFLPNDCCGQPTLPVTVTVTAREVA